MRTAHGLLTAGEALLIFLEGTRSSDGKLQPPELGTAMIALRAGVPIVPVALINSDRLLPRDSSRLHWSQVTVAFAEPLTFPQLAGRASDRAALREVSDAVARRIADLLCAHGAAERVPGDTLAMMWKEPPVIHEQPLLLPAAQEDTLSNANAVGLIMAAGMRLLANGTGAALAVW